jgi:hypothetical protein
LGASVAREALYRTELIAICTVRIGCTGWGAVTVAFTVFVSLHILHILQVGASACTDVQVARIDACSKLGGDTGWGAVTVAT